MLSHHNQSQPQVSVKLECVGHCGHYRTVYLIIIEVWLGTKANKLPSPRGLARITRRKCLSKYIHSQKLQPNPF